MDKNIAMIILGVAFHCADTEYMDAEHDQGSVVFNTKRIGKSRSICLFNWETCTFYFADENKTFATEKIDPIKEAEKFIESGWSPFSDTSLYPKWLSYKERK